MTLKDAIQLVESEYTLSPDKIDYCTKDEEDALRLIFEFAKLKQQEFNLLDGRDE